MEELKINKAKIKKKLDWWLNGKPGNGFEFDIIAKCYMYLEDKDNSILYFNKAIEKAKQEVEKLKELPNFLHLARRLMCANYYRIIGSTDEMIKAFKETLQICELSCTDSIKEKADIYSEFFFGWATAHFHLGNYKEAYEIGKYIRHGIVPLMGYTKGLLNNNKKIIEKTLGEVIKDIKNMELQPYQSPLNIEDPWEWYEIGRQLLGLPSILDIFKEEK